MDQDLVQPRGVLLGLAQSLAARGAYDEALSLLAATADAGCEGWLLRGKIAAQTCDHAQAALAFNEALALEPQHPVAIAAKEALHRGTQTGALVRRTLAYATVLGTVLAPVLVPFSAVALFSFYRAPAAKPAPPAPLPVVRVAPQSDEPDCPPIAPPPPVATVVPEPPELGIEHAALAVVRDANATVVTFTHGLFDVGDTRIPLAHEPALEALAHALGSLQQPLTIEIEGRTDDQRFRRGSVRDHASLAFARALAVADELRRRTGLRASNFVLQGSAEEPSPMSDDESRALARSVVVRVRSTR